MWGEVQVFFEELRAENEKSSIFWIFTDQQLKYLTGQKDAWTSTIHQSVTIHPIAHLGTLGYLRLVECFSPPGRIFHMPEPP